MFLKYFTLFSVIQICVSKVQIISYTFSRYRDFHNYLHLESTINEYELLNNLSYHSMILDPLRYNTFMIIFKSVNNSSSPLVDTSIPSNILNISNSVSTDSTTYKKLFSSKTNSIPTKFTTSVPSSVPSNVPSSVPSSVPTSSPTSSLSSVPTSSVPTSVPSKLPTSVPSKFPTLI